MTPHSATVVGLGRVGLSFAGFLASRGVRVKGVESDARRVEMIASGEIISNEPRIGELIAEHRDRIELSDLTSAVQSTDFTFIVVPTASRADGSLSDDIARVVVREAALAAAERGTPHLITVVSTLSPGSTRGTLAPLLPANANGCPGLCYSPVFVALGSVLDCLEHPSFVLVGADEQESGDRLMAFYGDIGYDRARISRTDSINAEIAKLTLNAYLSTKIAFANAVASVCDRIAGADVDDVLRIIGRDPRVGAAYLRAGTPFGGPCLPRDTEAFIRLFAQHEVEPTLASAVKVSNDRWYRALRDRVLERAPHPGATIGVIGLTYKPQTDFMEEGFGLKLAHELAHRGFRIRAYDAGLSATHRASLTAFTVVDDLDELVRQSDVSVITCLDDELSRRVAAIARPSQLVDFWHSGSSSHRGVIRQVLPPSLGDAPAARSAM